MSSLAIDTKITSFSAENTQNEIGKATPRVARCIDIATEWCRCAAGVATNEYCTPSV